MLDLGLCLVAVGDVVLDADVLDDPPVVVGDRRQEELVVKASAVGTEVQQRHLALAPRGHRCAKLGEGGGIGLRPLQYPAVAAQDLLGRVTRDALEACVDKGDGLVGRRHVDDQ